MKQGISFTKGSECDEGKYKVDRFPNGKNLLTGSTHEYQFRCVELEVFLLE